MFKLWRRKRKRLPPRLEPTLYDVGTQLTFLKTPPKKGKK